MKIYDKVKVINLKDAYKEKGITEEMIGTIISPEIRNNKFYVVFIDPKYTDANFTFTDENQEELMDDIFCDIHIKDLELVEIGFATDEMILEELPKNNPNWWCKVEEGFILNLLGEKKNKIPYDYNS
ncbi:MAG: hypothetical protein IJ371_02810 [Clostridia bacterium]|nr:hypothetical protein [Clostridia bacterium]